MKIYQLSYSTEDFHRDYGFFSSRDKAQEHKDFLLKDTEDMYKFWNYEIQISEIEVNKILTNHVEG